MRRAAKVDANHRSIVERLEQLGMAVWSSAAQGKGFPDLVVGWRGINGLFEVKNPKMFPSDRKLRPEQIKFFETWKGQVAKVETVEEIEAIMQRLTGGMR